MRKKTITYSTVLLSFIFALTSTPSFFSANAYSDEISFFSGRAAIEFFSVYGTHMNLSGTYDTPSKDDIVSVNLLLFSPAGSIRTAMDYQKTVEGITFDLSDTINGGLFLDAIPSGMYIAMLECSGGDIRETAGFDKPAVFQNIEYYTLSRNGGNRKIDISFAADTNNRSIMYVSVQPCSLPEDVYDIVIDPGHGGSSPGAVGTLDNRQVQEKDLNLDMSLLLKPMLEQRGYKVALTRDTDVLVPFYGPDGRMVKVNAQRGKYLLSIHNNSNVINTIQGTEIYIANDSDPLLASLIADESVAGSGGSYSTYDSFRIMPGVYNRPERESDLVGRLAEAAANNFEPYEEWAIGINYYAVHRETGGITTGAFVDGRDPQSLTNTHRDSLQTAEGILCEMGYVNNEENLRHLVNHKQEYMMGIAAGIEEYLNREYTRFAQQN